MGIITKVECSQGKETETQLASNRWSYKRHMPRLCPTLLSPAALVLFLLMHLILLIYQCQKKSIITGT